MDRAVDPMAMPEFSFLLFALSRPVSCFSLTRDYARDRRGFDAGGFQ
jgi:hypothetical protein